MPPANAGASQRDRRPLDRVGPLVEVGGAGEDQALAGAGRTPRRTAAAPRPPPPGPRRRRARPSPARARTRRRPARPGAARRARRRERAASPRPFGRPRPRSATHTTSNSSPLARWTVISLTACTVSPSTGASPSRSPAASPRASWATRSRKPRRSGPSAASWRAGQPQQLADVGHAAARRRWRRAAPGRSRCAAPRGRAAPRASSAPPAARSAARRSRKDAEPGAVVLAAAPARQRVGQCRPGVAVGGAGGRLDQDQRVAGDADERRGQHLPQARLVVRVGHEREPGHEVLHLARRPEPAPAHEVGGDVAVGQRALVQGHVPRRAQEDDDVPRAARRRRARRGCGRPARAPRPGARAAAPCASRPLPARLVAHQQLHRRLGARRVGVGARRPRAGGSRPRRRPRRRPGRWRRAAPGGCGSCAAGWPGARARPARPRRGRRSPRRRGGSRRSTAAGRRPRTGGRGRAA